MSFSYEIITKSTAHTVRWWMTYKGRHTELLWRQLLVSKLALQQVKQFFLHLVRSIDGRFWTIFVKRVFLHNGRRNWQFWITLGLLQIHMKFVEHKPLSITPCSRNMHIVSTGEPRKYVQGPQSQPQREWDFGERVFPSPPIRGSGRAL